MYICKLSRICQSIQISIKSSRYITEMRSASAIRYLYRCRLPTDSSVDRGIGLDSQKGKLGAPGEGLGGGEGGGGAIGPGGLCYQRRGRTHLFTQVILPNTSLSLGPGDRCHFSRAELPTEI